MEKHKDTRSFVQEKTIAQLPSCVDQKVCLKGWVHNFRSSGKICFIIIRDGTGICQCVLSYKKEEQTLFDTFKKLTQESTIQVTGVVKKWKNNFEIEASDLKLLSPSQPFPISKKEHGIDFLMKHRHLWTRSQKVHAILRVRHFVTQAIHLFFKEKNFIQTDPPIFTPNACEGTSSLFPVETDFMDSLYLSQSGQMYLEALSASLKNVYCISPVFRAEKSSTRRHLMEFWMCEAEMAFCDLDQNMNTIEALVVFIVQHVLKNASDELKTLSVCMETLQKIRSPFPRMHYEEASKVVLKENPKFQKNSDFGGGDETILGSMFEQPLFVHHYPVQTKAFYMKQDTNNKAHCLSCDLLAPQGYGELVGGGQREDNIELLKQSIKNHKLDEKNFSWYVDLRRYGSFPHGGFGLGVERLICWICGLKHVREAVPFPRVYGRKFFESEDASLS